MDPSPSAIASGYRLGKRGTGQDIHGGNDVGVDGLRPCIGLQLVEFACEILGEISTMRHFMVTRRTHIDERLDGFAFIVCDKCHSLDFFRIGDIRILKHIPVDDMASQEQDIRSNKGGQSTIPAPCTKPSLQVVLCSI